jgi:4'-phosphopantetheinyl transferase EntD
VQQVPSPDPSLLAAILPDTVACAELFGDHGRDTLFASERAVVAHAVDKRRREFASVRYCARRALRDLGIAPVELLPGDGGAPQWPAGIVGSMTHADTYRGAAVARAADVITVGIDAEANEPLPDDVREVAAGADELAALADLADRPGPCWDRLLFSAKESVYKAWFPVARRWLGFEEARVRLDPAGRFEVDLLVPAPAALERGLTGRWAYADGLLVTAVVVANPSRQRPDP